MPDLKLFKLQLQKRLFQFIEIIKGYFKPRLFWREISLKNFAFNSFWEDIIQIHQQEMLTLRAVITPM